MQLINSRLESLYCAHKILCAQEHTWFSTLAVQLAINKGSIVLLYKGSIVLIYCSQPGISVQSYLGHLKLPAQNTNFPVWDQLSAWLIMGSMAIFQTKKYKFIEMNVHQWHMKIVPVRGCPKIHSSWIANFSPLTSQIPPTDVKDFVLT